MTAAVSFTSRRTAMSPAAARKQAGAETIAKGVGGKQDNHHDVRGKQIDVTHVAQVSEAAGAESDVDELVDSDTERASEAAAKAAVVKTTSKSSKTTKSGANNNAAKKSGTTTTTPTKKPSSGTQKEQPNDSRAAPPSSTTTMGGESNADGTKNPNSNNVKDRDPQHVQRRDSPSSRESLGRTATGGAVPYYYPQSGPQNGRQTASPSNKNASKRPLASKETSTTSMPRNAVAVKEEDAHGGGRDLTPEEVDKFLALIEKYDLDTTNDDDMARSVTEVYQEWLEWCAKRNVKSSKSKQALVSEFPKLYNGHYGNEYQERAMGIVQRQQEARALAANGGGGGGQDAGYMRDRGGGVYSSAPDAASTAVDRATAQRPAQPLPSSSTLRSSPNGANLRQAGRPEAGYMHAAHEIPPSILESMHVQIRDEIWREANMMLNQIVHDRFVEVAAENHTLASRIEQLEVHSDNLAQWVQHLNRVQEDFQHSFGGPPPPPPGHMSNRPPYDDVVADESGRPRQPYMGGGGGGAANGPLPPAGAVGGPPSAGPSYHPAAHGGPVPHAPGSAYGAPIGSPHHRYSGPMRRSMTPPRSHYGAAPPPPMHGAPYHEPYDRHDVPPPPHHPSHHPMPPPHQQHPAYHSSPRVIHPHPAAGASGGPIDRHVSYHDEHPSRGGPPPPPGVPMHGGGGGGPVKGGGGGGGSSGGGMHPPAGGYDGRPTYGSAPYHPPSRDDRPHARRPESPASGAGMDSRHAKRPRNSGGGVY